MHPPIRSWNLSVESVDQLRKQLLEFRRQWAEFAARSGHLFQAFREKGADFPNEFLNRLCDLQNRKADLHERLRKATAAVPADTWQLSAESASLHTMEQDIDRLRQKCREQEQRFRDWRSSIEQPLAVVAKITTASIDVRSLLSALQTSVRQLLAQLEDVESLDCDQAETWCEVTDALLNLIADRQPAESSAPRAPLADCERWFQAIEHAAGRSLAIAAIRGELRLDAELLQQHQNQEHVAASVKVTAGAVEELQQKLQQQNDRIAKPRPVTPTEQPPPRETIGSVDAERELMPLIQGLRQLRDGLMQSAGIGASDTHHPLYDTVQGLGNLSGITKLLLEILAARDSGQHNYRQEIVKAVHLLAEAQSAVREQARICADGPGFVPQQDAIFHWLKHFVSEDVEQIRVERFMRLDGAADPAKGHHLATRIRDFRSHVHHQVDQRRLRQRLEHAAARLRQSSGMTNADTLLSTVEELLAVGTAVTSAWLRDLLLEVADWLPDSDDTAAALSDDVRAVLKNMEDFRIRQIQDQAAQETQIEVLSPEVLQVREWLRGKTIALVAGEAKPEHRRRIEKDFQLKSLVWISAGKKDRIENLAPQLNGAHLLILVTGLIGHKHSDLRQHAEARGIPWVQTKQSQGYGSSTLAAVIVEQASKRFRQAG